MATESPIRMSETGGKWPTHKKSAAFVPSSAHVAVEELGLLQKGHTFRGSGKDGVPNRSGSAPPSMEGSFLAIDNLISQQIPCPNAGLMSLNDAIKNCESEEQLRADPAYISYYCSNVNLNPRLPPPLISRENRRVAHLIGRFGNNREVISLDDNSFSSSQLTHGSLPSHKEESEDDPLSLRLSDDIVDRTNGFLSGKDASSLTGQHKRLVDIIQEDFPRTPSPVYNESLSYGVSPEAVGQAADSSSSHDPCMSASNVVTSILGTGLLSSADHSAAGVLSSRSSDCTKTTSVLSSDTDIHSKDGVLINGVSSPDDEVIASGLNNLNLSSMPNLQNQQSQEQRHRSWQNNSVKHQVYQQASNLFQVQKSQMNPLGGNGSQLGVEQFFQGPSKISAELQQGFQSSGLTPPLYATAAAYITSANPFYPNLQAPGMYSPQFGTGGYGLSNLPPYVGAYPHHGALPLVFDGTAGPSFSTQTTGFATAGIAHGADLQHLSKFGGQLGFAMQPSFSDPFYMQYYQQPFGEAFSHSGQYDPLASRGSVIGSQNSSIDSQKRSDIGAQANEHKFRHQRNDGVSNLHSGRGGITSHYCYGNSSNMSILMQYPSSPHTSPVLPVSPVGGTGHPGGRNEMRSPSVSGRYASIYSGWQGQRGSENFHDPKLYNFLEELKSGKGRRFELSDIAGHIVEFSADQHGSRFIQQKLESCSIDEKSSVFKEVLPCASKLMTDVFGNYVIQKFFEYGSPEQRKELAAQLAGQILPLSLQMYGCRVIQKALDVIELEQKVQLVRELDGHVMRCVRDQNGNHVIQKCIESVPADKIGFIISAFSGQVATLSMHPYGCRVIQRVLEHCTDEMQCQFIVDEILESVCALAQDQYGNYVTQHVLERGKPNERSQIISKLLGHIVQLSQHKFASNVVEKCLEYGGIIEREQIIEEIVGHSEANDNLLAMMKDQFANYVVQKLLETCTDGQRALLLSRIRLHAHALKKYTYGKHIVARFEHQFGEENQTSG